MPKLAAEIPSRDNGGLNADGLSVVWKLKQGVKWHDGQQFTADDVVFNWQYAADPATAAVTSGSYADLKVDKIDDYTVRITFDTPRLLGRGLCRHVGMIIPKHVFEPIAVRNRGRHPPTWRRSVPALTSSRNSTRATWLPA